MQSKAGLVPCSTVGRAQTGAARADARECSVALLSAHKRRWRMQAQARVQYCTVEDAPTSLARTGTRECRTARLSAHKRRWRMQAQARVQSCTAEDARQGRRVQAGAHIEAQVQCCTVEDAQTRVASAGAGLGALLLCGCTTSVASAGELLHLAAHRLRSCLQIGKHD